mmetsp:Transcript_48877/g.116181  ORF Transcript_48877/g.116181 Transcript_48877/m.116181 type:complete len:423 (+) Transcript_48877:61-1329(+)
MAELARSTAVEAEERQLETSPASESGTQSASSSRQLERIHTRTLRQRARRRHAARHGAEARNQYLARPSLQGWGLLPEPGEFCAALVTSKDMDMEEFAAPVVTANVYDIVSTETNNRASMLGLGIFHLGIEVFGVEWSFGALPPNPNGSARSGIYPVMPCRCPIGVFRESIPLGHALLHSAHDTWLLLERMSGDWLGDDYHVLSRNCLHFCEALCRHLGVEQPPGWVNRLAYAADAVLTPVLWYFAGPADPSLEVGTLADQSGERAGAEREQSTSTPTGESKRSHRRRSWLSIPVQTVLEFEKNFDWALPYMLHQEEAGRRRLEASDDFSTSVASETDHIDGHTTQDETQGIAMSVSSWSAVSELGMRRTPSWPSMLLRPCFPSQVDVQTERAQGLGNVGASNRSRSAPLLCRAHCEMATCR